MSAAGYEVVTVQSQPFAKPRQERISGRVRIAIDAMVMEALPRPEAAKRAGITEHALYKALRKPPTLAYMQTQLQALRESAAARTIAKAEKLMDSAQSEHVQADMTKWLAGIEGIAVVTKTESLNVHKHFIPGLTFNVINGSQPGDDAHLIDGQVREAGSPNPVNGLPRPVPHPSMRNAAQTAPETDGQPAKREGRGAGRRGEKS
jgi:hypothetical protein